MHIERPLPVGPTHLNIGELALIREFSPSAPDNLLTRLTIEVWILGLDNWHHLSSEETIGRHELELARRLDSRVGIRELDVMDLLLQLTFEFACVCYRLHVLIVEMISLLFETLFDLLGKLILPLRLNLEDDVLLREMRHLLLHIVELLVLKKFLS